MKLRMLCVDMYVQFLEKYRRKDPRYKHSSKNEVIIVSFLIELHKECNLQSIGCNFIYRYLIYQFDYWKHLDVEYGDPLSFDRIFAKKSLGRYFNRSKDFHWFNAERALRKRGITKEILNRYDKADKYNFTGLDENEEREKQRFHNTPIGLSHCLETTTLYNHKSHVCQSCKYVKECIKFLKSLNEDVYMKRGYEENTIE